MVKRAGLARRSKRRLVLTPLGRRALTDPDLLWMAATTSWSEGEDFDAAVIEVGLAILLDQEGDEDVDLDRTDLQNRIATIMTELGWRTVGNEQEVRAGAVGWALGALYRRGTIHRFVPRDGPARLTDVGRLAARTALRARAIAPRDRPV